MKILVKNVLVDLESLEASDTASGAAGAGAAAAVDSSSPVEKDELSSDSVKAVLEEVRGYSITPTTFISREYGDLPNKSSGFKDIFQSPASVEVVRFGLNSEVEAEEDVGAGAAAGAGSAVSKYTNKSGTALIKAVSSIKHEEAEIAALQQAVNYLLNNEVNAVLVDIFARQDGVIKFLEGGEHEIHTVVLYKNPADEDGRHSVTVIDPSNVAFSAHLGNPDIVGRAAIPARGTDAIAPKIEHDMLLVKDGVPQIIILSKARDKIYVAADPDNIGPSAGQYRDCIDVAVKLALGFNAQESVPIVNKNALEEHEVIRSITNNFTLDTTFDGTECGAVRIKQSSNSVVVKSLGVFNSHMRYYTEIVETVVASDEVNPIELDHIATLKLVDTSEELSTLLTDRIQVAMAKVTMLVSDKTQEGIEEITDLLGDAEGGSYE